VSSGELEKILESGYVVDPRALTARTFSFFPSSDGFSATVLP